MGANVEKAVIKLIKLKDSNITCRKFSLTHTTDNNAKDIILDLNINKATPNTGIPTKILKVYYNILAPTVCKDFIMD